MLSVYIVCLPYNTPHVTLCPSLPLLPLETTLPSNLLISVGVPAGFPTIRSQAQWGSGRLGFQSIHPSERNPPCTGALAPFMIL